MKLQQLCANDDLFHANLRTLISSDRFLTSEILWVIWIMETNSDQNLNRNGPYCKKKKNTGSLLKSSERLTKQASARTGTKAGWPHGHSPGVPIECVTMKSFLSWSHSTQDSNYKFSGGLLVRISALLLLWPRVSSWWGNWDPTNCTAQPSPPKRFKFQRVQLASSEPILSDNSHKTTHSAGSLAPERGAKVSYQQKG